MSTPVALDVEALLAFLGARLDETEALAKAATPGPWKSWIEGRDHRAGDSFIQTAGDRDLTLNFTPGDYGGKIPEWEADQDHIARHDPARVLREVAAMRELTAVALETAAMIDGEWGDGHEAAEIAGGQCQDYGEEAAIAILGPLAAIWGDKQEVAP